LLLFVGIQGAFLWLLVLIFEGPERIKDLKEVFIVKGALCQLTFNMDELASQQFSLFEVSAELIET
jgi:hypothetical protein